MLLQRLLEALAAFKKPPSKYNGSVMVLYVWNNCSIHPIPPSEHSLAHLLVSIYITHLLDMEWQDYDNALLSELRLPEFLLQAAFSTWSGSTLLSLFVFLCF